MAIGLTNMGLVPAAGQAALLPNQPIIHNAVADGALTVGAIVALSTATGKNNQVVVKQAAVTDTPCGVVVYNAIKTGFVANDKVSYFPENSYVFLPAGAANITRGARLQFNAQNQVVATTTANNGYIGVALTVPNAIGDLIVVKIAPGK